MRVGFIGLGAMGQGMARNLVKAGHDVCVWNRTAARAQALEKDGALVADSLADACDGATVVFTMVSDDSALIDVVSGSDDGPGLEESLAQGGVHVSLSTISVDLSSRLAAAHRDAGQHFVAAPVFGRPDSAAAAKLTIVAAGEDAAVAQAKPLLEAMGQKVFVIDTDPPKANVVKLAGNFLIASMIESLGEAFALLRKSGVDPAQFLEIVNGNLFRSPVYENYGTIIAKGRFTPPGFRLALGLKDVRLILAAADSAAAPMPVASLIRDHLLSGVARGKADLDWSALARIVAEDAGLET
jgi:3-hydroxyisobutyrate dehydrogenase-like beta-hydroxyacid dehydrogenase